MIVALGIIFVWGGLFYPIDRLNDGVLQITWACIWIAISWNFIWGTGSDIFERPFKVIRARSGSQTNVERFINLFTTNNSPIWKYVEVPVPENFHVACNHDDI